MHNKISKYFIVLTFVSILLGVALFAQDFNRKSVEDRRSLINQIDTNRKAALALTTPAPELPPPADSLAHFKDSLFRSDSTRLADSLAKADSLALLRKSSLEQPAFTNAADSIIEVFTDGQRMVYYYGTTTVKYQNMELTADYMEYNMKTGEVFARGVYDSLSGEWKGRPVMKQGKDSYNMEKLRYNFNSRKARITNMITSQDDGILHGSNIKMQPDKSINISSGKYTVCDLEEPHYFMTMSVVKVVTEPSQKTVFGPAGLVVEGVHLPIGIPFGFIPKKPTRATGLLMPTFGEETARGFFMKDAGMYFVFGDNFDFSVTGDYFTLGSWAVDVNSRYKFNYKSSGNLSFNYSNDQTGEKGSTDFVQSANFGLRWSHQQDSKAHPGTSFSASVNFSSPSNSRFNSRSVDEALQAQTSSSISYSKNWNGRFNLSINALHSQNTKDSSYTFTLPNVTFSMSTIYPFKSKNRVGKEKPWEKISFGYNTTLQNRIGFKASEFGRKGFTDKFQNGMAHNFSIGLPSFSLFKYINVSPSISYGQNWFFRHGEAQYNKETNRVDVVQGKGFSSLGVTQTYSGGLSMSTRLYGMFNFGSLAKIQAIRHVVSPSLSISLSPEKGTYANGYRTYFYTDKNGEEKRYEYNIYQGQIYSAPGKGRSASASFSIGNNLEAKVRDDNDTTGLGTKKIKLIDNLNLSSSYNFLADSMKMSNIGVTMSTNLFEKVSLSANANFDPYAVNERGVRYNKFALAAGQGLARLTGASASLSYSISGKGSMNGIDGQKDGGEGGAASYYQKHYYHPVTGEYIPGGWIYYTNPNVPWSLNFSYSFNYSKRYSFANSMLSVKNNYTQTLNASGSIKLTPRMSINVSSGFDVMAMKMTTTQISAQYDLHCFKIDVSWLPLGKWQSYSFRIAANAASLADLLKFKKSSSFWDN